MSVYFSSYHGRETKPLLCCMIYHSVPFHIHTANLSFRCISSKQILNNLVACLRWFWPDFNSAAMLLCFKICSVLCVCVTPVLLPGKSHGRRSLEGCSPWGPEESGTTEQLHFNFHFHALEKEMATHSSVLAWKIPGAGELGGLPSMGLHRVRHDWSDLA